MLMYIHITLTCVTLTLLWKLRHFVVYMRNLATGSRGLAACVRQGRSRGVSRSSAKFVCSKFAMYVSAMCPPKNPASAKLTLGYLHALFQAIVILNVVQ